MADADQHDAGDGRCLEWPAVVNSPDTTLQGSETILGPDTLPSLGAEYRELGQNAGELLPQIRNVMTLLILQRERLGNRPVQSSHGGGKFDQSYSHRGRW